MKRWSTKRANRDLHDILCRVPDFHHTATNTATVKTVSAAMWDLHAAHTIASLVMKALVCPDPDPDFGDFGHQENLRDQALEALAWGQKWVKYREKHGWSNDTVILFKRQIPAINMAKPVNG
jgi:hypothetical protein